MIATLAINILSALTSPSIQKIHHTIHQLLATRPKTPVVETILRVAAMQAAREALLIPDPLAAAPDLHLPV